MKNPENTLRILAASAAAAAIFSACAATPADDDTLDNDRVNIVLTKAQTSMVSAGNDFSVKLLRAVCESDKSIVFSPMSVQYALAMLDNGAAGNTAEQIGKALGFEENDIEKINDYYAFLTSSLLTVDKTSKISVANCFVYNTAYDSVFGGILPSFKDALQDSYGAEVCGYDFDRQNQETLRHINSWASNQTAGMIDPLLDEVVPEAFSYLMNAIYFKGKWEDMFSEKDTRKQDFTLEGGGRVSVDMMHRTANTGFATGNGFSSVSLPYGNGAFRMTVVLPESGKTCADVAGEIDAKEWIRIAGASKTSVVLYLPKFETESTLELNDILVQFGMTDMFSSMADFSNLAEGPLGVSRVFQKARIKTDEDGSEAAAVTVVEMKLTSAAPGSSEIVFKADRPFLYAISEVSTGAILFMGQYAGK